MSPAVVAFDAFGTLFDLGALRSRAAERAGPRGGELFDALAARLVPLTWHATAAGSYRPLPELAVTALESAAREIDLPLERAAAEAIAAGLAELPAFPDAAAALAALRGKARLAVLSNGTRAGVRALVEKAGLEDEFEQLLVADDVRRFKPAPEVYRLAVDAFAVAPASVALVSGNEWDVAGAKLAGLRAVWVARGRPPTGFLGIEPDAIAERLSDLPAALGELDGRPGRS